MRRVNTAYAGLALAALLLPAGCSKKEKVDEAAAAPPKTQVVEIQPDHNLVKVDRPERFELVTATLHEELPQINVTGSVTPDIEKSVPVVSLASGRVVGIYAKLGDDVKKGQLLLKVLSNDITNAFQNYAQSKADEQLTRTQAERSKLLYDKGAVSLNDLQVAEGTHEKALVAMNSAAQQIRTLGADVDKQDPVVNVYAPAAGTIVEQNVFNAASVHTPDNQANLFTIANLSTVWVMCDVYENDLPMVRVGDRTDVQLNAYPDRVFHGRVSNIGKVLDPAIRAAKVRIALDNPGIMRAGMFVTATFYGQHGQRHAEIPSTAILHLHDRDWVFVPAANGRFQRREVTSGKAGNGTQTVLSGIAAGQQVVKDALALNSESDQ
jgi:cobalt-zinc-cadmium efflux system membrane fusion protein